nr:uncharacterized protein [Zostera marina]
MATVEVQSVTHVLSSKPAKVESCEPVVIVEKPESQAVDDTAAAKIVGVEQKPVAVIEEEEEKINEEVIVEEKKLQVEADKVEVDEDVVAKEVEGEEEAAVEAPAQVTSSDVPAQVAAETDVPAQVAEETDVPAQVAEEPPLATTVIEVVEDKEASKETPAEIPGVEEESKE